MGRIDYSETEVAAKGRDGDKFMAHVAPGEMVVPPVISEETRAKLHEEMLAAGLDPNEYTVGAGMSINPETGLPEFGFFKKVFKSVKKVVSKVMESPIGKVALAAAAVYTGGAALGAWGAGAAGAASTASSVGTITWNSARIGATAASSGGLFSGLGTVAKVAKAASSVAQIGGVLSGRPEEYSTALSTQGGTAVPQDPAGVEAQAAEAAEEEERRKRKGSGANILTSPLGVSAEGRKASQALLG